MPLCIACAVRARVFLDTSPAQSRTIIGSHILVAGYIATVAQSDMSSPAGVGGTTARNQEPCMLAELWMCQSSDYTTRVAITGYSLVEAYMQCWSDKPSVHVACVCALLRSSEPQHVGRQYCVCKICLEPD